MPNCEHSCSECAIPVMKGVKGFLAGLLNKDPNRPQFSWTRDNSTGTIVITPGNSGIITDVVMWSAKTNSTTRRDFRLLILGPTGQRELQKVFWFPTKLHPQIDGTYVAKQAMPTQGWAAHYVDVQFKSFENSNYHLTTEVAIIPDYLPFPSCGTGPPCKGVLV